MFPIFDSQGLDISIFDSQGGATIPQRDIPRYLALWDADKLPVGLLIGRIYSGIETINDALDDMHTGKVAGRCMITL
jgi:alcohol dehydrogenase